MVVLGCTCRYTAGYPATPLQLKLRNAVGLDSKDVDQLKQQLEDTATLFAQQECVCVFNLVDDCQVWWEHICTSQLHCTNYTLTCPATPGVDAD